MKRVKGEGAGKRGREEEREGAGCRAGLQSHSEPIPPSHPVHSVVFYIISANFLKKALKANFFHVRPNQRKTTSLKR